MKKPVKVERELVFTHPDFPLDVSTWEKHPDYPPHTHDFSEIVIIAQGTGFNVVGEEEFPLGAGDVFVLHGERPHGYRNTRNLTVINVTYDPALLAATRLDVAGIPGYQALFVIEPALRKKGRYERHMHLDMDHLIRIKTLTDAIENELHSGTARRQSRRYDERHLSGKESTGPRSGNHGCQFMAMGHFMILVGLLSRWYLGKPTVETRKIIGIGEAISFLETRSTENIEVDALARMAGMSRRSFYRVFQEVTGESPLSWLLHKRIMKAVTLLKTTDKNVTETAFECGFEDSNYFTRQFRRVMGISPREFRTRQRIF
ncbi:MAG: helix-turn-helix domain-containing protein [Opitutaceae bacterium]|jgi:AraC family L-rhamnose operon transcriptional activator RhaR/AraC family L-rhamnose operon regulatory protein RhaS|nr:helix-turn-helix domain-containing protein [Opitutaceae bacterium]